MVNRSILSIVEFRALVLQLAIRVSVENKARLVMMDLLVLRALEVKQVPREVQEARVS